MSKKLISLVLVLAVANMASAIVWIGNGGTDPAKAWEDTANWDLSRLPVASDGLVVLRNNLGTGSNIVVSTAVSGGVKPQMKASNTHLNILSGGSVSNDGSFEQTQGVTSLVEVQAGAVLNVAQKLVGTIGTYKIASTGTSVDTLDIYGTVNVKGSLATSDILIAGATTSGNAYVNIRSTGLLNVDAYTINTRGLVTIWSGGVMKILGDKTAQASADIAAGRIVGGSGGSLYAWQSGGYTYVVPEPATVALLGLGSLLLYRKKH